MLENIYWNIRLFFKKGKEPYVSFFKILNFCPRHIIFYQQALVHKSLSLKLDNNLRFNNERMEFLGDAILDAAVADILYNEYSTRDEDFLTTLRSKIVQRETLNQVALQLGIDKFVKSSIKNLPNTHVFGNALEALIGAIYLDRGYYIAKQFIHSQVISNCLNLSELACHNDNFKSILLEWSQKEKIPVEFVLLENSVDTDNVPFFKTAVSIYNQIVGVGNGTSKKESHQQAAREVCSKLENEDFLNKIILLKSEADRLQ